MDAYTGEIRLVGFGFAPRNWAICAGQIMSISQNTALFSLLGTTYGGNGSTTFALPNLSGRAALHTGTGPGLSNYPLGAVVGTESVALIQSQMPAHIHTIAGDTLPFKTNSAGPATSPSPAGTFLTKSPVNQYGEEATNLTMLANSVTGTATTVGGSTAHENMMPYLSMYYIICVSGYYPPRP
jgi:microcystin-dependent protein